MGFRQLTLFALAALMVTVRIPAMVAAGNGAAPPAEEATDTPAAIEAPAPTEAPAPIEPPAATAPETYDLKRLVTRLRDTKAIGVFTKLALKNQIDDLMDRFRRYHAREEQAPLDQLRDHYNLLFMKVVTVVQDKDPALGQEIAKGREILWGKLADPGEFARL